MNHIKNTSLLGIASELLVDSCIIKLPENVDSSLEEVTNVLLYAATSTSNSISLACKELREKYPDKNIRCANSIHTYIKSNNIDDILESFRKINSRIINNLDLKDTNQDIAIDFHDIPFYGDKNTKSIRGIKPKNGTSWGYSYCTLDIVGKHKLTLDICNINGLTKNYSILIESLVKNVQKMGINVRTLFLDREFFNIESIDTINKLKLKFIMAAKSNKKISEILEKHKKEFGFTSTIFKYKFEKGKTTFNIIAIANPKYNPNKNLLI